MPDTLPARGAAELVRADIDHGQRTMHRFSLGIDDEPALPDVFVDPIRDDEPERVQVMDDIESWLDWRPPG